MMADQPALDIGNIDMHMQNSMYKYFYCSEQFT